MRAGGQQNVLCLCRSSATIQKPSERLSGRGGTDDPRDLPVRWQPAHQVLLDQKQRAGVVFVRLASESFIRRRLKFISDIPNREERLSQSSLQDRYVLAKELSPTHTVPKHAEQECHKLRTVCLEAHDSPHT